MRIENFEKTIDVETYIRDYVNVEEFVECCKKCPMYQKKWSCPEFDFDPVDYWKQFKWLRIYGKKIYLEDDKDITMDNMDKFLRDFQNQIADELFEEEKKVPGSVSLSAGSCIVCGEDNCSKKEGLPCRYPEKLRYSIESLGGNVGLTVSKLLGIDLLWCEEGKLPEYFVMVGGLLY